MALEKPEIFSISIFHNIFGFNEKLVPTIQQ